MDLEPFVESPPAPLPERPVALFVGVLERYKAVDVLADAWRLAAPRVPDATLHLVGRGTLREVPRALVARASGADALDRVALDRARSRGRSTRRPCSCSRRARRGSAASSSRRSAAGAASSGAASAGSPTSSTDGVTASSSSPATRDALADALVRVLSDRALAERLGAAAHAAVEPWLATPEEYARQVRELVDEVTT